MHILLKHAACIAFLGLTASGLARAESPDSHPAYEREIKPLLRQYCYDCHGDGSDRGGVSLDTLGDETDPRHRALWYRVLKNIRKGLMPPARQPQPAPAKRDQLVRWIKRDALALDPRHPDPGRVTVRRLNRVEYRNTIRDLMGIDFDTNREFPSDDTGHGFDNIGDVLTISPMLLEKYFDAAKAIVVEAVPTVKKVVAEHSYQGESFLSGTNRSALPSGVTMPPSSAISVPPGAIDLSFYLPSHISTQYVASAAGTFQIILDLRTAERFDDASDLNQARLRFLVDGQPILSREFARQGDKAIALTLDLPLTRGAHTLAFEVQPVEPASEQIRNLRFRLNAVKVRGPLEPEHWVKPESYDRFFLGDVPDEEPARTDRARKVLQKFATRAFRRPVDEGTVDRLMALARTVWSQTGATFEQGIAQAFIATLASPRFIFREEPTISSPNGVSVPIDEFALASRLSYFFWSSMPDEHLFQLARARRLRNRLASEVQRMMKDPRSIALIQNFGGQWLQTRDIPSVQINALSVYLREHPDPAVEAARETFRRVSQIPADARTEADKKALTDARAAFRAFRSTPKPDLTIGVRKAMQRETEMTLDHVLRGNRSLLELIDSNYTFLNDELAQHYRIDGVKGTEMRKVRLPQGSPRGGVLTQGTVLAVTSNPTRTSPVKRGVFVLNAILGTPPPPPPPNVPSLEDVAPGTRLSNVSLRDALAQHASNALCRSCHNSMDPIGLALENFNAMGMWRDAEANQKVDPSGQLITGEAFADVREFKRVLARDRRDDFYYTVVEKLLIYALGRGLDFNDLETVDRLVEALKRAGGRPMALFHGIVRTPAFQETRWATE